MTTSSKITHAFAILAPVPYRHLKAGLKATEAQEARGIEQPIVAFGSMAFEVFRKADDLCGEGAGDTVEVFLYASRAEEQSLTPQATWHAVYVKHIESKGGHYPSDRLYERPETAREDDKPTWAIFWQVRDLRELDIPIPIRQFQGLDKKTLYKSGFIPEGPMLVEHPPLSRR